MRLTVQPIIYDIMGVADKTTTVEAPQKLSFWQKTKRAVKAFFEGAVEAAPKALLIAGIALATSATLGHQFGDGFNLLKVGEFGLPLVGRWIGIGLISSSISGAVHSFEVLNQSDEAPKSETPTVKAKAAGAGKAQEVNYGMSPGMTPPGAKLGNNLSR